MVSSLHSHTLLPTLLVLLQITTALPAPAPSPIPQNTFRSDPADVISTLFPQPSGPPGSSGTLDGGPSLVGYNKAYPTDVDTTLIPPSDFQLAPGQSEDGDLGLFLDFKGLQNFQPNIYYF